MILPPQKSLWWCYWSLYISFVNKHSFFVNIFLSQHYPNLLIVSVLAILSDKKYYWFIWHRTLSSGTDHQTTSLFEVLYLSFHWSDPLQTSNKALFDQNSKCIWSIAFLIQHIFGRIIYLEPKFQDPNFWGLIFGLQSYYLDYLLDQIFLDLNLFWTQIFFQLKIIWTQKFSDQNLFGLTSLKNQ